MSQFSGRDSWLILKISRKSLRPRWRFTAFPTRRDVIMPILRSFCELEEPVACNCRKKCGQRKVIPRSLTFRKSLCLRSRCILLKRILPLGSKAFAAFSPPCPNYGASASCCHAGTKTKFPGALYSGGSVSGFHLLLCLMDYEIKRKGVTEK